MDVKDILVEINSRLPFYNLLAKDLYEVTGESREARDERMAWWREARFGMFIHWGLYSVAAGKWNGIPIPHYGEWIMHNGQIPQRQYAKLADRFNPVKFDAGEWVGIAKKAGMKYIVVTAKHHDGFSLFHTKLSKYNMVDATPFKRDVIKELADACKDNGMRFGLYYSQLDWLHAGYSFIFAVTPKFRKYLDFMKGQLEELLTCYGPICELFFDGEWMPQWNMKLGAELESFCRSLQPNVIINNRVGKRPILCMVPWAAPFTMNTTCGDFETPEQFIPEHIPPRDWETNMTMNDTFGYKENDDNWKSSGSLIRKLVEIASRNGNFLLNVGPTGDGVFPEKSVEILSEIGNWMKNNGDSIYGAVGGPLNKPSWGRTTRKQGKIFLHIFDWPASDLVVSGINEDIYNAYLLSDPARRPLNFKKSIDKLRIDIPRCAPDSGSSVIVLETNRV
ncbi:MAG TPA: alpha-L-fucosidase [bacterium]|nr:alpha-L-fucosidase [bacterium]